jgi:hypothetical protein
MSRREICADGVGDTEIPQKLAPDWEARVVLWIDAYGVLGLRTLKAVLELVLVGGGVEVAVGGGDEVVGAGFEGPFFVAADADAVAGAVGAGVGSGERPVVGGVGVVLNLVDEEVVHEDLQVGEGGHEALRGGGDGVAADGGGAVDGEGAGGGEVSGYGGGDLSAPGGGVIGGEDLEGGGGHGFVASLR